MSTDELSAAHHDSFGIAQAQSILAIDCWTRIFVWPLLHKLVYLLSDLLALTLPHMLGIRLVEHFLQVPFSYLNPFEYHRYYIPFFAAVLYLFEGYKSPELRRPEQELERSSKAVAVSFLGLVLFNFVGFRAQPFSRYLLVSWFVLSLTFLITLRFTLRGLYMSLWKAGFCRRKTLLIGSTSGLAEFQRLLSIQRHNGYEFVGALLDTAPEAASIYPPCQVPTLGGPEDWETVIKTSGVNVVIVAFSTFPKPGDWLGKLLHSCRSRQIDVELYSRVLTATNLNYEHDQFSGCFRFVSQPAWSRTVQRALKSGIDIGIGIVGSAFAVLLTPIIYALLYYEDRGSTFYAREYMGQDGQVHYYLKFRTMKKNADSILRGDAQLKAKFDEKYKLADDPRVLRVGRFLRRYSIDEIPQFFSLLKGDLTLVGPRVISQEETIRYGTRLEKLLSFKPGLTGFWQVMGRQTTGYEDRVLMDMFYIDHWSIWLDLLIIAKTFWKVIRAEGAY